MNKETLTRANELVRCIHQCEQLLEYNILRFEGVVHSNYFSTDYRYSVPECLNSEIISMIKKKLAEYRQELESL